MQTKSNAASYQKHAILLGILLIMITLGSILWIVLQGGLTNFPLSSPKSHEDSSLYAHIYQNGDLLQSIHLSSVTESYRFTITNGDGGCNEIEVRPGSIGIISADCPDKLCVHQGFIESSLLPITCLPNRLVIQIRPPKNETDISPDIVTY